MGAVNDRDVLVARSQLRHDSLVFSAVEEVDGGSVADGGCSHVREDRGPSGGRAAVSQRSAALLLTATSGTYATTCAVSALGATATDNLLRLASSEAVIALAPAGPARCFVAISFRHRAPKIYQTRSAARTYLRSKTNDVRQPMTSASLVPLSWHPLALFRQQPLHPVTNLSVTPRSAKLAQATKA